MESSLLAIMMWFETASNRSRTMMTNLSDFNRETNNILHKCDFSPTLHRAKYMHVFVHACDTSEPQQGTTTILGSLWRKRTQRILAVGILCATAATENIQRCWAYATLLYRECLSLSIHNITYPLSALKYSICSNDKWHCIAHLTTDETNPTQQHRNDANSSINNQTPKNWKNCGIYFIYLELLS